MSKPITCDYSYFAPNTLAEAAKIFKSFKNKKIAFLAGGTDVIPLLKEERLSVDAILDIKALNKKEMEKYKLKKIEFKNGKLTIGALVTFTEMMDSKIIRKNFPTIYEMSKLVASVGVRNRATMVGNICSAVPCMDSGPVLKVFQAKLVIKKLTSTSSATSSTVKRVDIDKFWIGPKKTVLKNGDLITAIEIEEPAKKYSGRFVKLMRYGGEDLAQANLAILLMPQKSQLKSQSKSQSKNHQFRISFGSLSAVPVRAKLIEDLLNKSDFSREEFEKIVHGDALDKLVEKTISPITDIRATKEYRTHMAKVMLKRGIMDTLLRFVGEGSEYGVPLI
ncbi:MAG: FAD binding domain-containing protein [Oligoflexia bacterium]|nr:FAD binding domain-containing protein [Oligoflexia bacterium]